MSDISARMIARKMAEMPSGRMTGPLPRWRVRETSDPYELSLKWALSRRFMDRLLNDIAWGGTPIMVNATWPRIDGGYVVHCEFRSEPQLMPLPTTLEEDDDDWEGADDD